MNVCTRKWNFSRTEKHHSFLKRANIPTRLKSKKRNFLLWLFISFFHSIFTYEFFKNYERQITFRLFVSLRSLVTFRFINVLLLNYCFDHRLFHKCLFNTGFYISFTHLICIKYICINYCYYVGLQFDYFCTTMVRIIELK